MGKKREVTFNFSTKGDDIPVSFVIEDGDSSYDTWLKLPGNAGKSLTEFLGKVKGIDGVSVTDLTITSTES